VAEFPQIVAVVVSLGVLLEPEAAAAAVPQPVRSIAETSRKPNI